MDHRIIKDEILELARVAADTNLQTNVRMSARRDLKHKWQTLYPDDDGWRNLIKDAREMILKGGDK